MQSIISSVKCIALRPASSTFRRIHTTAICEAARKGTREKARKKKVKVEVKKIGFIPHNLRNKDKLNLTKVNLHIDDSWKAIPKDNAYPGRYYRWRVYSVPEAIECHRETHHPSMYNVPNAPLNVEIELNMFAERTTRYVDNFHRITMIPHKFDHGEERKIIAFAKDDESLAAARNAGVTLAGGQELINDITSGALLLTDYQYIIAHPNILADLVSVRGLMKRRFPNPKNDTLGTNLGEIIHKFANGISYSAMKNESQQDFGLISTCVGTLDMDIKHLEENLVSLLKDVNSMRPKRQGKFITRVILKSPPSGEKLKIDPFVYVEEEYTKSSSTKKTDIKQEPEDEGDEEAKAVN